MQKLRRLKGKNKYIAILIISVAFLCSAAANRGVYPVRWYPGFTLYEYFENGKQANTIDDIKNQIKQDWEFSSEVESIDGRTKKTVKNCEDFFEAKKDKMYPRATVDRWPYSNNGLLCIAAQLIVNGKNARNSYIENLKVDGSIASYLPSSLTYRISREAPRYTSGSWADVVKLKVVSVKAEEIKYSSEGEFHFVRKIATGDFNGDGVNDILLLITHGVTEGSHFTQDLYHMTRDKSTGLLKILKSYSAL